MAFNECTMISTNQPGRSLANLLLWSNYWCLFSPLDRLFLLMLLQSSLIISFVNFPTSLTLFIDVYCSGRHLVFAWYLVLFIEICAWIEARREKKRSGCCCYRAANPQWNNTHDKRNRCYILCSMPLHQRFFAIFYEISIFHFTSLTWEDTSLSNTALAHSFYTLLLAKRRKNITTTTFATLFGTH